MAISNEVAKASNVRIERERARVEDFVITANITLIAAFVVMLTVSEDLAGAPAHLASASLIGLVISLLSCLWHKFRHPIRLRAWEVKRAELSYQYADKIVDFVDTFVKPNPHLSTALAQMQQIGRKEKSPEYIQMREVIVAHLRNVGSEMRAEHRKIFSAPLREPNSKLLYTMDVLSRRVRYPAFGMGVLLFLASVLVLLA